MPFFNFLVVLINLPRLLLHLLVFAIKYDRCKDDVKVNIASRGYRCGVVLSFLFLLVFEKPFRNLYYWRIGKLKYLMWYWLWPHPCFTLATNMIAGKGFNCVHPFSTIVNAERIGDNFTVRNTVTIGNNKSGERPTIGNNVSINANAVVIGPITIGDNVIIGAGAVVTKNIPDNCVVVGNPAYILKENGVLVKRPL
jgi:serine O-acetyltransferase